MSKAVLIALLALVALTLVWLVTVLVHGRIAEQAIRRARLEDLPQMLETSSRTLISMCSSLRFRVRQVLPGTSTEVAESSERSAAKEGAEGEEQ
ncbi:hypothetical protein [Streptomyces sp. NPDC001678]|uniref:hypothetical protein n=1 Tax=Streptomyces sp. NPDC001678 TaxID=3364599 RepID=UPI0036786A5F